MQVIFARKVKQGFYSSFLLLNLALFTLASKASLAALNCPDGTEEKAGICVPINNQSGILGSKNLVELITKSINLLLYLGGAIAVLFVIIGGYQYLTSGGNEEAAEKGRKTVTNAIIGILLMALAYTIINVVVGTLEK
ncbi:MAG: pilin [Patescibacteria group bacterium]|nr:pilin [Patescibacteria group bacterium]